MLAQSGAFQRSRPCVILSPSVAYTSHRHPRTSTSRLWLKSDSHPQKHSRTRVLGQRRLFIQSSQLTGNGANAGHLK